MTAICLGFDVLIRDEQYFSSIFAKAHKDWHMLSYLIKLTFR